MCKYLFFYFQVKVAVDDENDNSPVFDRHIYQGTIRRTATTGLSFMLDQKLPEQVSFKARSKTVTTGAFLGLDQ